MKLSPWVMAARPQTLILSMTPIMVGTALAWAVEGKINWLAGAVALGASICIQLGTNLHNDAADSIRGGDGPDRIGPPRATGSGLLKGRNVRFAAVSCFALAAVMGTYLIAVGGWPIFLLGVLSISSGWAYTGGPFPIAYTPLSEFFVVAFFGVGAVSGTYWLNVVGVNLAVIATGFAVGSLTAAVLLVNNHRDAESDARVGRKTLAIIAGRSATNWIYAGLMLLPFALLPVIGTVLPRGHVWPALIALPPALALIYRFCHQPRSPGLNRILVRTVQTQFMYCLLLCSGLVL